MEIMITNHHLHDGGPTWEEDEEWNFLLNSNSSIHLGGLGQHPGEVWVLIWVFLGAYLAR